MGKYVKPVVGHRLTIYQRSGAGWKTMVPRFRLCVQDQASVGDGALHLSSRKLDMLWINGHAVNFFNADCFSVENDVPASTTGLSQAQVMTTLLPHIELLPSSNPLPLSLATALANRSILLSPATEPPAQDMALVGFQGLPPCFTAHDPKACMAMVADIDHDGNDDVVILDRDVHKDVSIWRMATLLMVRQGQWTVVANHAACAEVGQKLEDLKVEFKPSTWLPIAFGERLYLPDEQTDNCNQHYPTM